MFLDRDRSKLAKQDLFDFRYLLLRGRTLLLMDTPVSLIQSVVTHTEHAIHQILFQAWPTMSALSGNMCWISARTFAGIADADRDNAACLYKPSCLDDIADRVHCLMMYAQDLDAPAQS